MEFVRVKREGRVATVTVDRPDAMNALNGDVLEDLLTAFDDVRDERAVVLTGEGDDAFVAGADIAAMQSYDTDEALAYCQLGHEVMDTIETFPAPVVAAVNGYAFGGGCELALACDLRVASDNAVIGQPEIDLGIVPGWGGTQRLARIVGDAMARRMVFFGERLDAQDAHAFGLVGDVVAQNELDEFAHDMAQDLAAKPRLAMQAAKEALNQVHETHQSAGLTYEQRLWSGLFGTHDQREGMEAFVEKRDAEFE